ncbi:MAG: Ppx/GppA phosphatase family protein [bacterium]
MTPTDPSIPALVPPINTGGEGPYLPGLDRPTAEERIHPLAGQIIAAVDVGSNAMRLKIARVTPTGGLTPVVDHREAVRLGADVFHDRIISERTLTETLEAFRRFQGLLESWQPTRIRAVATSAMREAQNSLAVIDHLQEATGITLETITALEEAELVVRAVTRAGGDEARKNILIIDVGGGSVEVSVVQQGRLVAVEGFSVGTVRLLQMLHEHNVPELEYGARIDAQLTFMRHRIARTTAEHQVELVVGIGGNATALADLAQAGEQGGQDEARDSRRPRRLRQEQLRELRGLIDSLLLGQRVSLLSLPERRADVIQPAAHLYLTALEAAGVETLIIPDVGVRDGVLWQIVDPHVVPAALGDAAAQIEQMARDIGLRYRYDASHGEQVSWLAGRLFDDLQAVHRLAADDRILLVAAAVLHDVGHLVNHGKHHLHTYYLIHNADFYGLTPREQEIVALVARFHRKGEPDSGRHTEFAQLSHQDRVRVTKMTALLRVADGLDRTHQRQITAIQARVQGPKVIIAVESSNDLEIERWAIERNASLFKRMFLADLALEALKEAPHA